MAVVCVRGPLRALAGGRGEHEVDGATLGELLGRFEESNPALGGWILDERGLIRRHINVFVDGERGDERTTVDARARVEVIPAITGG